MKTKSDTKLEDTLIKLASIQANTKSLDPNPKTLKYFPLRKTARLFVIADSIMASVMLISRYLITTRIVTFPIYQLAATSFYLLLSCFGIFQIFSENSSSFPFFLICFPIAMVLKLMSAVILGIQTFDMGLMTDNCGDVEICYPHVKPLALAGWIMVAGSISFLIINLLMLSTYWQLSSRILEEEHCLGYGGKPFMHSHAQNHQYSHHHYPINYSHSNPENNFNDLEKGSRTTDNSKNLESGKTAHEKIRTPQPKRLAKNVFENDPNEIITITKHEASKLSKSALNSTYNLLNNHKKHANNIDSHEYSYPSSHSSSVVSVDYKLSPLDFCAQKQDAKNIY